ncbi:MAG TPA: hypothetical protein VKZ96_03465 [Thermomicrobiales bacterium]|nr:hypothetical protein [Thermomicrobiales bacterium]
MAEGDARLPAIRRADVPTIQIITGRYARLPAGPLALFEVNLVAGDDEDAVLSLRLRMDEDPLVCLVARAGGRASFIPAAPMVLLDPLHACITGADAAGSVTYR